MTSSAPIRKQAGTDPCSSRSEESIKDHRVQVAAAKLRVALDERLGRLTPTDVKSLANEDF